MAYGIKFALTASVRDNGEAADDTPIWTVMYRYEQAPFVTKEDAQRICDVLDSHQDSPGLYTYRPVELKCS